MGKILSALLLSVAVPACSDSSVSLSDLPAAAADAVCTYGARCGQMPDVASCKAAANFDTQLLADVQAGRTKYDGKAAAACFDAMRSGSCNYSDPFNAGEPQACKDAFKGTVADNGACYADTECVSGSCSSGSCSGSGCCTRACSPSTAAVSVGGDCSGAGALCVSGAFCQYGTTSTCAAKAAAGQSCDTSYFSSSCADGTSLCGEWPEHGDLRQPSRRRTGLLSDGRLAGL